MLEVTESDQTCLDEVNGQLVLTPKDSFLNRVPIITLTK